jgi:hypothetical protein
MAIPLRNIKANTIIKVLTILFLLLWVFLKQLRQMKIQFYVSFISASFELIKITTNEFKSNAYYPESQGAFERVHQSLTKYNENNFFRQSKRVG